MVPLSVITINFQYTYYLMCERNVKQWYLVIIPCSKKTKNKQKKLFALKEKLPLTEQPPVAEKCWQRASCDIWTMLAGYWQSQALIGLVFGWQLTQLGFLHFSAVGWGNWIGGWSVHMHVCVGRAAGAHITPRGRTFKMQFCFHADPLSTFNSFLWAHNSFS